MKQVINLEIGTKLFEAAERCYYSGQPFKYWKGLHKIVKVMESTEKNCIAFVLDDTF